MSTALREATNDSKGAHLKTFARRKPKDGATPEAPKPRCQASGDRAAPSPTQEEDDDAFTASLPPVPAPRASNAARRRTNWHGLSSGRPSSVLQLASTFQRADYLRNRGSSKQREVRQAAVAQIVTLLREAFAEVDDEVLKVESAGSSPEPPKRHSGSRSSRRKEEGKQGGSRGRRDAHGARQQPPSGALPPASAAPSSCGAAASQRGLSTLLEGVAGLALAGSGPGSGPDGVSAVRMSSADQVSEPGTVQRLRLSSLAVAGPQASGGTPADACEGGSPAGLEQELVEDGHAGWAADEAQGGPELATVPEGEEEEACIVISDSEEEEAEDEQAGTEAEGEEEEEPAATTVEERCAPGSAPQAQTEAGAEVGKGESSETGAVPEALALSAPAEAVAAAEAEADSQAEAEAPAKAAAEAAVKAAAAAAAARRRRWTTAGLTPLQRLLALCGQEPTLPPHQLPSMDELLVQLAAPAAAADGSEPSTASTSAAAGAAAQRPSRAARKPTASSSAAAARAAPARLGVEKVGEGSYGEAWRLGGGAGVKGRAAGKGKAAQGSGSSGGGGGLVVKIVPIEGSMEFNGGPQKTAADMLAETLVCRELSGLAEGAGPESSAAEPNWTAGFVRTRAVAICRGPYSPDLVRAWEKWDEQHESENEPVSLLPADQLYWVIAMEHGGTDLERFELSSWDQVRSVILQVAVSLAAAEASLGFEHRDLHWGNVLVRPLPGAGAAAGGAEARSGDWLDARLQGQTLRVASCGVAATVIDFTNSRLQAPDGSLAFCDLSADASVFEGTRGDVQFDTYRWMRDLVGGDWAAFCPETNCLWLSYLAEVLAGRFGAAAGRGRAAPVLTTAHKRQLREFRKRAVGYANCGELLRDGLFAGLLQLDA
ncbi:hypothetical protein HYH03_008597 [Edaphochlamys debaryana]|uniref:non-specific serine/threonine protein kinase n=1 Tax=Edaphochlamys debaryana TaxID=47281 RepID=A0A835Y302_9CHLO|nr:hypothetical protein HYH03_008597 [Edaphochlamys debaryana]|eukprot:KAG2493176.1 hypothetical protein HYH03_008597 [Edaphochlamys debaryana]